MWNAHTLVVLFELWMLACYENLVYVRANPIFVFQCK